MMPYLIVPEVDCCVFSCSSSASLRSSARRRIFHDVPTVRAVYPKGSHPLWRSPTDQERERPVRRFIVIVA
jgi:hypothetical protein